MNACLSVLSTAVRAHVTARIAVLAPQGYGASCCLKSSSESVHPCGRNRPKRILSQRALNVAFDQQNTSLTASSSSAAAIGMGSSPAVAASDAEDSVNKFPICRKVAVIGAGAAGLVAARELLREGHKVVVLEQGTRVGGVWVYTESTESDLLGTTSERTRVHGSMYASLRTNLPRELMGYLDYPFLPFPGADERRYPGHEEVGRYLESFAVYHDLLPHVLFGTAVDLVRPERSPNSEARGWCDVSADVAVGGTGARPEEGGSEEWVRWRVRTKRKGEKAGEEEEVSEDVFDAVMICNGHFFEPRVADIPGLDSWPGKQIHSHNYRRPEPFQDQVVVVLGAAASGEDISVEISKHARKVVLCSRTCDATAVGTTIGPHGNRTQQLMPTEVRKDGAVVFPDGSIVFADAILHCTGYHYSFPFLDTGGYCQVSDNRLSPLYQHVFPPAFAPSLAFIGLPFKVVPFPLMQLQSRWVAQALSGKSEIPSRKAMAVAAEEFYANLRDRGVPLRHTHNLSGGMVQWEYMAWLADACESSPPEWWRPRMYDEASANKRADKDGYRDRWKDEDLRTAAVALLEEVQNTQASLRSETDSKPNVARL